ncbi:MAG: PAS domain S-box protein [Spirochaetia bacterium]|nr:PAS domain S-box protein [Spirochaetia bacterium]
MLIVIIFLQLLLVVLSIGMIRLTTYRLIWILTASASGVITLRTILLFLYKDNIPSGTVVGNIITIIPVLASLLLLAALYVFYRMYKSRTKLELSLRQDEQKSKSNLLTISAAIEQSPSITVITDLEGNIEYVNPKFTEQTGYEKDEVIGKNPRILKSDHFQDNIYEERWETISRGGEWRGEFLNKKKNGDLYWEAASISSIKDPDGKIMHYLAVKEDITKQKRTEDALNKSEKKLKSSLEEKNALLRELYHRTKNNMQVISAMLNLSASKLDDNEVTEVFTDLDNRIQSMSLVHEKLYQSQNLSNINLKEYITDLCSSLLASYHKSDCNVSFNFDLADISVLIDAAVPIGQIITELISNSFKHAFPGRDKGEISIKLTENGNSIVKIDISDNGIGANSSFSIDKLETIGLQTVFSLGENQLHGNIELDTSSGFRFSLEFRNDTFKTRV